MQIIRHPLELEPKERKVALAIGTFDGVHLGHQQVIRQAVSDAEQHEGAAVAVTFDRHPASIVAPARAPSLILSLDQKLRAIAATGVDAILLIPFDEAFSRKPGEDFIRELASAFRCLHSITVGSSFTFGHHRDGDVMLLRRMGRELGFQVHGIAAIALDGEPVSSTRIRQSIRAGVFDKASEMLGRAYTLCGRIVRGDNVGATLGFPTANLDVAGLVLPPNGVYAAHAYIDGARHRAVLNIGVRPTLAGAASPLRVEAHLLGFSGDLYGKEMEITFAQRLRDEQRFPSLDALREQIQRDVAAALKVFRAD